MDAKKDRIVKKGYFWKGKSYFVKNYQNALFRKKIKKDQYFFQFGNIKLN